MEYETELQAALECAVDTAQKNRSSAAVAIGQNSAIYRGASILTDTHILDICAEQAALCGAMAAQDFGVQAIVSFYPTLEEYHRDRGIQARVIADFSSRTGQTIRWAVYGKNKKVLLEETFSPAGPSLVKPNSGVLHKQHAPETIEHDFLRKRAKDGLIVKCTSYPNASGYGAVAISADGQTYASGQYASTTGLPTLHGEMVALVCALMDGCNKITDLAVISTKNPSRACTPCGCCLQFMYELARYFNWELIVHSLAENEAQSLTLPLDAYLPHPWSARL